MISNSLDVDFINGDINGRSCKNEWIIEFIIQLQWHNMTFQIIGALVGFFCLFDSLFYISIAQPRERNFDAMRDHMSLCYIAYVDVHIRN